MKRSYWLLSLLLVLMLGCVESSYVIVDKFIYLQKEGREAKDWKVIWQDDFNASELDTTKWTKIGPNKADWGKHMTRDSKCYSIEDGKLILKGIVNEDTLSDSRPYLTGGVYTKDKFAFRYGKIEIHAKLESAKGAWPAMWMLPQKNSYGGWPKSGEIDILEHLNYDKKFYITTHSYYTHTLGGKDKPKSGELFAVDVSKYNTYGLEWYPDKLVFTLNGIKTFEYPKVDGVDPSQWPYDKSFYVLIDQQLGGSWIGDVDTKDLPVRMFVDWVKVSQ